MKIHRLLFAFSIVLFGVVACESAHPHTISPSPNPTYLTSLTPSSTFTRTKTPTKTSTITPTITKTPYPWPDLHTAGPYLYLRAASYEGTSLFAFYELDGSGRMDLGKTGGCHNSDINAPLRWCTYIEGGQYDTSYPEGGVILRLVDNWNGTSIDIADLLPWDYRERQQRMVDEIKSKYPSGYYGMDLRGALESLYLYFSWSPDGNYLAFTAMIDGNSTDVYVYDARSGIIQRKDKSPLNVRYLFWSPDSKYILFRDGIPSRDASQLPNLSMNPLQTIQMDSTELNKYLTDLSPMYWFSSSEMLMHTRLGGCGGYPGNDFYIVDISTGTQVLIWKGFWVGFAIDKENGTMLISSLGPCEGNDCPNDHPGLFLGPIFGDKVRIADGLYYSIYFHDGLSQRFIIESYDENTRKVNLLGVSNNGSLDDLGEFDGDSMEISFSPDSHWIFVFDRYAMTLFDESDQITYTSTQGRILDITWKTNSQGFFYMTDLEFITSQSITPFLNCFSNATLLVAIYTDLLIWLPRYIYYPSPTCTPDLRLSTILPKENPSGPGSRIKISPNREPTNIP